MDRPLIDPRKLAGASKPPMSLAPPGLLTVTQVTLMVKRAITETLPQTVHVVGEVSNFKRHTSGHLYLTLKDPHCELSAVMWRSAAAGLKFKPENGLEVIATGSIDVFERAGRYQLVIRRIEPRGMGALELAFRQLLEKLKTEGLFDPQHKVPLPRFPRRIGVVTSPTGAAIRDVLRTLSRRWPVAEVFVYPVAVQGPTAPGEIAAALTHLDRTHQQLGGIDVVIVGRGGGSLEDLWAFNEEVVARAIFACRIPVVSAVGHEMDVTISDFVADVRAATPTAAAELVAPDRAELAASIGQQQSRLTRGMAHRLALAGATLAGLLQRSVLRDPSAMLHRRDQVIDELTTRMTRRLTEGTHRLLRRVSRAEVLLQRIHPHALVSRTAGRLTDVSHRLRWALYQQLGGAERRLARCVESLRAGAPAERLPIAVERVDRLARRMALALDHRLRLAVARVTSTRDKIEAMSYRGTLRRGFSITRWKRGRRVVREVASLRPGDRLLTETGGGEVESEVVDQRQAGFFDEWQAADGQPGTGTENG